jgi:ribosomal protein S14
VLLLLLLFCRLFAVGFSMRQLSAVVLGSIRSNTKGPTLNPYKEELLAEVEVAAEQIYMGLFSDCQSQDELGGQSGSAAAAVQARPFERDILAVKTASLVVEEIQQDLLVAMSEPGRLLEVAAAVQGPRAHHHVKYSQALDFVVNYWNEAAAAASKTSRQEVDDQAPADDSSSGRLQETCEASGQQGGALSSSSSSLLVEVEREEVGDFLELGLTDSEALLLSGPVNAEVLMHPQVWWHHHQDFLGLRRRCDVCGKDTPQVRPLPHLPFVSQLPSRTEQDCEQLSIANHAAMAASHAGSMNRCYVMLCVQG